MLILYVLQNQRIRSNPCHKYALKLKKEHLKRGALFLCILSQEYVFFIFVSCAGVVMELAV